MKAKLSEQAFNRANNAALDEFTRLSESGESKENLLRFAQTKAAAAQAQMDSYESLISGTKIIAANLTLPKYLPPTGFVANPQLHLDWLSRIQALQK